MFSRLNTRLGHRLFQLQRRSLNGVNGVIVSDLLNKSEKQSLVQIQEDSTLRQAAKLLEKNKVGALIVVNQEERVLGIMTSRDIQRAVANYNIPNLSFCKTKDIMTTLRNLSFVTTSCSVESAAEIMQNRNIRHIPVLAEDNKCVGMLSFKDVINEVLKPDPDNKQG